MTGYIVYILYSQCADKHYTGYTTNLDQRLISHNQLGDGWTSKYRPWRLIFTKEFQTKADAMHFENWLKSGAGRDFVKTIQH